MKKIYIVEGSTGEYSDHTEWIVCAYEKENDAQTHVVDASAMARELIAEYETPYDIPNGANPFDPKMRVDYTGVNYCVIETELHNVRHKSGE